MQERVRAFLGRFFEAVEPGNPKDAALGTETVTKVRAESADEDFASGALTQTVTRVKAEQADEDHEGGAGAPWASTIL